MKTLIVNLEQRSYPIYIGENLLDNQQLLRRFITSKQVMIVTNERLAPLFLKRVSAAFPDPEFQCDSIILPDGEQYKTLATVCQVWDALLQHKHRRNTTLVALGGGVIGDMTGFAAACYQRGVNFIQIPTTLLAQVDASVGGKTGVNHPQGKNMIGAFHQPLGVIIDTVTLETLDDRQLRAGVAEIIKAALIKDSKFFSWLEQNMAKFLGRDAEVVEYAILRACEIKSQVVSEDEKETTDIRALLNLGHTFGHAIEQNLGYGRWLHGEAVAVGLLLAADVSARSGWISNNDLERIKRLLVEAKLPTRLPTELKYDKLLATMALDKKMLDARPRLVLLKAIGDAVLTHNTDIRRVQESLQKYGE